MSTSLQNELLYAFEVHSVEKIRNAFEAGVDPNEPIDGVMPIELLISMYTRSNRFADCFAAVLKAGARFEDELLKYVLLDDAESLGRALEQQPERISKPVTVRSAYTSLVDVTLLHVAAEFGNLNAARSLIDAGADIEAKADIEPDGSGGHSPIFHTVNSNGNHCEPILKLLLEAGAKIDVSVAQLMWGRGCPWETILFDVNPVSYAMMGLLPQFHRDELQIHANIRLLLGSAGRDVPEFANVPNRYLIR